MTALKQALATVSLIVCIISLKTALASDATQGSKTGQTITTQTKAAPVKNEIRRGTVEELVRIRCATDGSDQWTTWTGRIFSFVPGERQKLLFNVVGANVARCKKNAKDQWYFTSRELMYYLDPKTNKPLKMWENPWTKRSVPVMHVANDLVQGVLRGSPKINISGPMASMRLDIPLFYPNASSKDESVKKYSPHPMYQAGEFFALLTTTQDLVNSKKARASMSFSWHRVGPWLPWMDMGEAKGYMMYTADGAKVANFSEVPELIRKEIETRLPRYRTAPQCMLKKKNETSWTYFKAHTKAYLDGQTFPLPAPVVSEECAK